jgi:capsule polysaccharide export protein KpsC/LpsZ
MHSWIEETIVWFSNNPNVDLVIRIHPAELTGRIKARDPIFEYICGRFPSLPSNIKVIQPDETISTYKLMEVCDLGIIFATKAGIEMAAIGKPLIVAGESWIRGRGLSSDPENRVEYFNLLKEFVNDPNCLGINVEKALNFAHNFFFKKTRKVHSIKALPYYPYLRPRLKNNWDINDPGLFQIVSDIERL